MLSHIYYATCQEIRYFGLACTAVEKFARFLLDLKPPKGIADPEKDRRTVTLTHEEIAAMIGTSRETVSRLVTGFKCKHLIELHGSSLVLTHKKALEELLGA
jgi:CRP/FNR family cyclic AMP-dependent transcriptional regulator